MKLDDVTCRLILIISFTVSSNECFSATTRNTRIRSFPTVLSMADADDAPGESDSLDDAIFGSRRKLLSLGIMVAAGTPSLAGAAPAVRPTAYRVDSTRPPTLLGLKPREEVNILAQLGQGSGTDKSAIVVDTINLNNMLNKAVFGTINAVSGGGTTKEKFSATAVCLGVPKNSSGEDVKLAQELLSSMTKSRQAAVRKTAMGLYFLPLSVQPILDDYIRGQVSDADFSESLSSRGVDRFLVDLYAPLWQYAKVRSIGLLALAPEPEDIRTVRSQGLQNVDPSRRESYVVDPNGFIALTQSPQYQIYTDRSLFKDFDEKSGITKGNFFSERILVHETAATAIAKYLVANPGSFVTAIAPMADLRYLSGINGRIPRIASFLDSSSQVSNNAITTILLNPSAGETLSQSRYMRLEIGTAPDTWQFQLKVADYLWFSAIPKVNMIPRLMN